jgi:hypothetical protein
MIASLILPIEDSQILTLVFPYSVEATGFLVKLQQKEKEHRFVIDFIH